MTDMTRLLVYDVFGRRLGVLREEGGGWLALELGTDGTHRPAKGVTIPPWIEEDALSRFLADLFHESASPARPDVVFLGKGAAWSTRK